MNENCLAEIYLRIGQNRDKELDPIRTFLRPKAAIDREIEEAVRLLELSRKGEIASTEGPDLAALDRIIPSL